MSDVLVRLRGVSKGYGESDRRVEVLRDLDLDVEAGEMVAVVGPSGVGKSTLLHLVGLLDRPESGAIELAGRGVDGLTPAERAALRNQLIGFVFQFHYLLDELDARDNVGLPLRIAGEKSGIARSRAEELLDRVGLAERLTRYPDELSGGEQQRVAVARALAMKPKLLLADEPTGNLDRDSAERVFGLIRELHLLEGLTSVIVTHNEGLAERCDRVIRLVPSGAVWHV